MTFCPKCGKTRTESSRFCPNCGHSFENSSVQPGKPPLGIQVAQEDFVAFVVNNAGYYLHEFKKFDAGGVDTFSASWNWSAFVGGFGWLLYRKMYMWAIVAFISMLIPYLGLASWIGLGAVANYLYYRHAKRKILEIRELYHTGEISVVLSQIGGVNKWVPTAATIFTILLLLLFMAFVFWIPFSIFHLFGMPSKYI